MKYQARIRHCIFWIVIFTWFLPLIAQATHIRAGEIRAVRVNNSSLAYNFIASIYTDSNSTQVEVDELTLFFGDGASQKQRRDPANKILIQGAATYVSYFYFTHTYSGNNSYVAYTWVANRNADVLNMNNSVQTTFYVETQVIIDPNIPPNSTPILTVPPVDQGQFGKIWTHNPGAYDPDGDSLSYQFISCKQWDAGRSEVRVVENYQMPEVVAGGTNVLDNAPATFTVNQRGDVVWDCPNLRGQYNIAIKITEWRRLRNRIIPIGYVVRDMQIIIEDGRNKAPQIFIPEDTCVVAGTRLQKIIRGTDPDRGDKIILTAYGYPFEIDSIRRGKFSPITPQTSPAISNFDWKTSCLDVRDQPILVVFKAADVPVVKFKLADIKSWEIRVVAPKPKFKRITAAPGKINLTWVNYQDSVCKNATSIQIWRRVDSSFYKQVSCETGIPKNEPYSLIATVSAKDTQYIDNNNGKLLDNGARYCYRLVATFPQPQGGKSYASEEVCAILKLVMPVMLEVNTLDTTNKPNRIAVKWSSPLEMDTNVYPPPYQYRLYRQDTLSRTFKEVYKASSLKDTSYIDTTVRTSTNLYKYQVALLYGPQIIVQDTTDFAQQINLKTKGKAASILLNYTMATPWTNRGFYNYIYRKNPATSSYWILIDSIKGTGNSMQYEDRGTVQNPLLKSVTYEYIVKTVGKYGNPKVPKPLPNLSPIAKGTMIDSTVPCTPILKISTPPCNDCESYRALINPKNLLTWSNSNRSCDSLVKKYLVYYKSYAEDTAYTLIASTLDTFLYHSNAGSLAGCYYIRSISLSDISSPKSEEICIDNCFFAELPNVFTPDGDNYNNVFRFTCVANTLASEMEVKIYNRWGNLIYEGPALPESLWDGKSGSKAMDDGLYYFYVNLNYIRLHRFDEKVNLKGWVMLLRHQ